MKKKKDLPKIFIFFPLNDRQVDDVTADLIISQLLFLDAEDSKKDIKLFINSPGGSVTAGMFKNLFSMFDPMLSLLCLCLLYLFIFYEY